MDAFAALPRGHPMVAVLELDVTTALERIAGLRQDGARVTLFAFMVRAIAVAISEHPHLNLVRHGRRLVQFEDVDVNVPVEVPTPDGPFPRQVIIRRAQARSVEEILAEIEAARARHANTGHTGDEDRWAQGALRLFGWLPWPLRFAVLRFLMGSAFRIKAYSGTTQVTSVSKFVAIPGFAFTFATGPRAALFVVGSVAEKPWARGSEVEVRKVLSLSVMVDHDLVDGAPVARFATRLRELVESADGLA
jgi:pyruvate/2-oxoglutarate dehydrogenase complex dihydrolipoamide acyltransferase (E2) component